MNVGAHMRSYVEGKTGELPSEEVLAKARDTLRDVFREVMDGNPTTELDRAIEERFIKLADNVAYAFAVRSLPRKTSFVPTLEAIRTICGHYMMTRKKLGTEMLERMRKDRLSQDFVRQLREFARGHIDVTSVEKKVGADVSTAYGLDPGVLGKEDHVIDISHRSHGGKWVRSRAIELFDDEGIPTPSGTNEDLFFKTREAKLSGLRSAIKNLEEFRRRNPPPRSEGLGEGTEELRSALESFQSLARGEGGSEPEADDDEGIADLRRMLEGRRA